MGNQQRSDILKWKVLPFATNYSISNTGVLIRNQNKRVRRPDIDKDGYHKYRIPMDDGRSKNFFAHRLVALMFIPQVEGLDQVNHKNGLKQDNRESNLEWTSSSGNRQHAFDTGLQKPAHGSRHGNAVLTEEVAELVSLHSSQGKSPAKIARILGINRKQVHDVISGKCWLRQTEKYLPEIAVPEKVTDDQIRLLCEAFSRGCSRKEAQRLAGVAYYVASLVYLKRTRLNVVNEYVW